jgi:hypothetical protein
MLCIPTHVRVDAEAPELVRALCALLVDLRMRGLAIGSDVMQSHQDTSWQYLWSKPVRGADLSITYVHLFHHPCHPITGDALTLGVQASPRWWPDADCTVLSPPKSETKARLRLVS